MECLFKGIDVSAHQGAFNWEKAKLDGVQFAILRAGYGSSSAQKDLQFERNYSECKRLGIPAGAYWFSYAETVKDAHCEAAAFIEVIKGKRFEFPLYYDLEEEVRSGQANEKAEAFLSALESHGYFAGIYTNLDWSRRVYSRDILKRYTVWTAQWGSKCTYTGKYGIWQKSSTNGTFPNLPKSLDINYAYIDFPAIIKEKGFNGYLEHSENAPDESEQEEKPDDSPGIRPGCTVRIKSGAKAYNGAILSAFVFGINWIAESVNGDRAVINKSPENPALAIKTPINTRDLILLE